jgi:gas vesicle protein
MTCQTEEGVLCNILKEENMNDDSCKSFAFGFLFGAVVGAAVVFFYAPKSGRETMAAVKEKAVETAEKAREAAEKAKEAALRTEKRIEEKLGRGKA